LYLSDPSKALVSIFTQYYIILRW